MRSSCSACSMRRDRLRHQRLCRFHSIQCFRAMFFVQRSYSTLLFRLIGRFNSLFDTLVRSNVTRCCLAVGSCCTLPG